MEILASYLSSLKSQCPDAVSSCRNELANHVFDLLTMGDTVNNDNVIDIIIKISSATLSRALSLETEQNQNLLSCVITLVSRAALSSGSSSASVSTRTVSSDSKSKSSSSGVRTIKMKETSVVKTAVQSGVPTYPILCESSSKYKVSRAVIRSLSDYTRQQYLAAHVEGKKYKYCSSVDCAKCATLFNSVPLTKCNHGDKTCTSVGLYPHLSRSVWKALHGQSVIPTLICFARHYYNPKQNHVEPSRMDDEPIPSFRSGVENVALPTDDKLTTGPVTRSKSKKKVNKSNDIGFNKLLRSELAMNDIRREIDDVLSLSDRSRSDIARSSVTVPKVTCEQKCRCGTLVIRYEQDGAMLSRCGNDRSNHRCTQWMQYMNELSGLCSSTNR